MHPLERQEARETLHALLVRDHAEVLADRENGARELVEVLDSPDVECGQKSSGQYGGRDVRKRSVARCSAPGFSSRTRSAAASSLKSKAPR
jgi:hypothetical protein